MEKLKNSLLPNVEWQVIINVSILVIIIAVLVWFASRNGQKIPERGSVKELDDETRRAAMLEQRRKQREAILAEKRKLASETKPIEEEARQIERVRLEQDWVGSGRRVGLGKDGVVPPVESEDPSAPVGSMRKILSEDEARQQMRESALLRRRGGKKSVTQATESPISQQPPPEKQPEPPLADKETQKKLEEAMSAAEAARIAALLDEDESEALAHSIAASDALEAVEVPRCQPPKTIVPRCSGRASGGGGDRGSLIAEQDAAYAKALAQDRAKEEAKQRRESRIQHARERREKEDKDEGETKWNFRIRMGEGYRDVLDCFVAPSAPLQDLLDILCLNTEGNQDTKNRSPFEGRELVVFAPRVPIASWQDFDQPKAKDTTIQDIPQLRDRTTLLFRKESPLSDPQVEDK